MVNEQCEHRNKFCFVCGLYTPASHGRKIGEKVEEKFENCFDMNIASAWYKPEIICDYCRLGLTKTPPIIKYALPMQWLQRSEHSAASCYFCINIQKTYGFHYSSRGEIKYELVDSVLPPVSKKRAQENQEQQEHMDVELDDLDMDTGAVGGQLDEPTAGPSGETTPPGATASVVGTVSPPSAVDTSPTFQPDRRDLQQLHEPVLFTQSDVNNLAKELRLNDKHKEILGSRLTDHNVVDPNFRITAGRKRRHTQEFDEMFQTDEDTKITYCSDVRILFLRMKLHHNPSEWRLFIDGGKKSLKAVLLHITNKLPSIPIAHGYNVPETYDTIKAVLKLIQYEEYKWFICADLKIVAILMGLTQGYAKHQCFLCLWEGRQDHLHYDKTHKWAPRNTFRIGQNNQEKPPLVTDQSKILLPPLHIKLGLVRNFTMKLKRDGRAYECLLKVMKKLGVSETKVANGKKV